MRSISLLPSLSGPQWPGVVAHDRVLPMGQIELSCVLMLNWIVWNRTVSLYKMELALNNLQCLICHKNQLTNQPIRVNRIDYILMNKKWINSELDCEAYSSLNVSLSIKKLSRQRYIWAYTGRRCKQLQPHTMSGPCLTIKILAINRR